MATTRSASRMASLMLWVTNITVFLSVSQMRISSNPRSSRVMASSAAKGSSIRSTEGCESARGRSRPVAACHRTARAGNEFQIRRDQRVQGGALRARERSVLSRPKISAGSSTLSKTVRHCSRTASWNTMPTSRGGLSRGLPL